MLEIIIRNSFNIVARTERLIDQATRLIRSGEIGEGEASEIYREVERLKDIIFVMDEAARLLRRRIEQRPEMERVCPVHATLQ